jgi:hypothetical protein
MLENLFVHPQVQQWLETGPPLSDLPVQNIQINVGI